MVAEKLITIKPVIIGFDVFQAQNLLPYKVFAVSIALSCEMVALGSFD